MLDLITIVLPVRNGETYLAEAIESVLDQTYENFELIIVDDFSTDSTNSISAGFAEMDSRVKLIRNPVNFGLPRSLNVGFAEAQGDLLTWTSHDNVLFENFLSSCVSTINSGYDFVYSDFLIIDSIGAQIDVSKVSPPENLLYGNCIGASFMYKREVYEKVGDYVQECFMYEDYEYWTRVWFAGFNMFAKPEIIYQYRRHELQLTVTRPMPESYLNFRISVIDTAVTLPRRNRSKAAIQLIPMCIRAGSYLDTFGLLARSLKLHPLITLTESVSISLAKIRSISSHD